MFALRGAAGASPLTRRRVHRGQIGGRRLPMPGGASPPMRRQVHRGRWVTTSWCGTAGRLATSGWRVHRGGQLVISHALAPVPRRLRGRRIHQGSPSPATGSARQASPPSAASSSTQLVAADHRRFGGLVAKGGELIEASNGTRGRTRSEPRRLPSGEFIEASRTWPRRPVRHSPRRPRGDEFIQARPSGPGSRRALRASPPTRRRVHRGVCPMSSG